MNFIFFMPIAMMIAVVIVVMKVTGVIHRRTMFPLIFALIFTFITMFFLGPIFGINGISFTVNNQTTTIGKSTIGFNVTTEEAPLVQSPTLAQIQSIPTIQSSSMEQQVWNDRLKEYYNLTG